MIAFGFDNSYSRLPARFFAEVSPTPVPSPSLIRLNHALAAELGLDASALTGPEGLAILAGNAAPQDGHPLAMAYAGHQFGNWVPQLGDGRAILLGEIIDSAGNRRDVQLKGAGRTPFSRGGDGRAPLGPVLREYIVSEAMAALGVPTTRALAAVMTGEAVLRESMVPGAVLTRVASSHIRVGTFQFFAAREDTEALRLLTDHVIERHYPEAASADVPALALLRCVIERQANLVAHWMSVGFVHGVMNTDNMTISGETIDYGPCAFMEAYNPGTVFSFIDRGGRYAFANQPKVAHWNLAQFAQALLPLLADTTDAAIALAQAEVDRFAEVWGNAWLDRMRAKLGLGTALADDQALIDDLLTLMSESEADFTLTFRTLSAMTDPHDTSALTALFNGASGLEAWLDRWHARSAAEDIPPDARSVAMKAANPAVIPRNHLVEDAITRAHDGDLTAFEALTEALDAPFDDVSPTSPFAQPAAAHEKVHTTFCGT